MFAPNGVDYEAFARREPEPAALAAIPRPRIGYTGHVKKQLDWPLMLALATRHREWSFVFVGKRSPHPEITPLLDRLAALPNVYFIGEQPTPELAKYPQHFDVCVMPYRANGYTAYIYPLKLHEYLATGQPVVGTRLPALEEFSHLVALATCPDEWSAALTAALEPAASCPEQREARRAEARLHDWDHLVGRIADQIEERLAGR
jgi:glycosyltransferase involved in cell wall biosynthesis